MREITFRRYIIMMRVMRGEVREEVVVVRGEVRGGVR